LSGNKGFRNYCRTIKTLEPRRPYLSVTPIDLSVGRQYNFWQGPASFFLRELAVHLAGIARRFAWRTADPRKTFGTKFPCLESQPAQLLCEPEARSEDGRSLPVFLLVVPVTSRLIRLSPGIASALIHPLSDFGSR